MNVDGKYSRFLDVPGDLDLFYHSVLKDYGISGRFHNLQSIRRYLRAHDLIGLDIEKSVRKRETKN